MEDMMGFVVMIILAIAASIVQGQNKKKKMARRSVSMDAYAAGTQKAREKEVADTKHRQEYRQKLEARRDELRAQMRQGEAPHEPRPLVAPTVDSSHMTASTVRPRMHVTPHTEDMFAGSMNASTGEGEDPCHEDDLTPAVNPCELSPRAVQLAPATSGLNLTWTGDAMVKAVVMQEILTRPCQRARR